MKRIDNKLVIICIILMLMAFLLKSFSYHSYAIRNMNYEVPKVVTYAIDANLNDIVIELYLDDIRDEVKDVEKFEFGTVFHINNVRRDLNNDYNESYIYKENRGDYARWFSMLKYEGQIVAFVIFDENYNLKDFNYAKELDPELIKVISESDGENLTLITMRNQYFLVVDYDRMFQLPFTLIEEL